MTQVAVEKASPIAPIIHLNGTNGDDLIDNLSEVWDALEKAAFLLRRAAPNGRDYYPVEGLIDKATEQHTRRLKIIRDLQEELHAEMSLIVEQMR